MNIIVDVSLSFTIIPIQTILSSCEIFFSQVSLAYIGFSLIQSLHCTTTRIVFLKCHFPPGDLFLKIFQWLATADRKIQAPQPGICGLHNLTGDSLSNLISTLSCMNLSHTDLPTERNRSSEAVLPLFLVQSHFPAMSSTASLAVTMLHPPIPTSSRKLQFSLLWLLPHTAHLALVTITCTDDCFFQAYQPTCVI